MSRMKEKKKKKPQKQFATLNFSAQRILSRSDFHNHNHKENSTKERITPKGYANRASNDDYFTTIFSY